MSSTGPDFVSSWSLASQGRGRTGVDTEQALLLLLAAPPQALVMLPKLLLKPYWLLIELLAVVEKLAPLEDEVEKTEDRHDGRSPIEGVSMLLLRPPAIGRLAANDDGGGNEGDRLAGGGETTEERLSAAEAEKGPVSVGEGK